MVPLDDEATTRVLAWDVGEQRSMSLRHALIHRRPGLWGDHPRRPRSVVLVREADGCGGWHVFGAGAAEPAVGWLTRLDRGFSLLAPNGWEGAIRKRAGRIERGVVETWVRSEEPLGPPRTPPVVARRLIAADAPCFESTAPGWALRGWGTFDRLIERGAAFGVPGRDGAFVAMAWTFESDDERDSLAVSTDPRFRRLGLGLAASSALLAFVEEVRSKAAVWSVSPSNIASRALARALGFSPRARETVLVWSP
jgi:GNAT superfamily N-acetyltransferase